MVSIGLCDNWRPLPGTFCVPSLYCHDFRCAKADCSLDVPPVNQNARSSLCPRLPLVCAYRETELGIAKICGMCRGFPYTYLRGMDICYINGRPRLARYLHDILFGGYVTLDAGVHSTQSKRQSKSCSIQEDFGWLIFRKTGSSYLLFHSAQGP